jgi:peptide/nickel transport system permease protein
MVTPGSKALAAVGSVTRLARSADSYWARFAFNRLVAFGIILVVLAVATFVAVHLAPGDPAVILAGGDATGPQVEELRRQLGLDLPITTQFARYLWNLAHLDLGKSYGYGQSVVSVVRDRFTSSLTLAGSALAIVLVGSTLIGMVAAAATKDGRHRVVEVTFATASSVVGSVPEYLAGTILALVFAVWLQILPVAGSDSVAALILPTLALSIRTTAVLARIVRVEALNVLKQEYIRTARSKRLPEWFIYVRHVMPNVLTSALTVGGVLFPGLIGSAVVVESVFARPGLGTTLVHAIIARDYELAQGIVLVLGTMVIAVNLMVDLILAIVDRGSLGRE